MPIVEMHIEGSDQVARSKFQSVDSSVVDHVSDVKVAAHTKVEFYHFIQLFIYNFTRIKVPWFQVFYQQHYETLVVRIFEVVKWIFPEFIPGLFL